MKAGGRGAVVNVASTAGINGIGSCIAYAASKGALITMTKSLARVLGPEIRVNAVCPGFIQGEWLRGGMGSDVYEAVKSYLEATNPHHGRDPGPRRRKPPRAPSLRQILRRQEDVRHP